jgi:uncharacterized protein (TIGR02145 family)
MKNLLLLILIAAVTPSCQKESPQILVGQNKATASTSKAAALSFSSITICNQIWMKKNLEVVTYRNGDPITQVTNPAAWATLTTGAWCYYNNDPANGAVYGKLYNWYAVNDPRGLAPEGWHIPSDAEWTSLTDCLGGTTVAGGKLKEKGIKHWSFPNTSATNSSRFTALPAGNLNSVDGLFFNQGLLCSYWSSSSFSFNAAYYRRLFYNSGSVGLFGGALVTDGFSVRCIKN